MLEALANKVAGLCSKKIPMFTKKRLCWTLFLIKLLAGRPLFK